MVRYSLLFLSLCLVLSSCNKDDSTNPEPETAETNFFALEVGNKWTYNFFRVNSETGELTNLGAEEEVEITAEEIVGEDTIYTLQINTTDPNQSCGICNTDPMFTKKVKDSLGYLVEVGGPILFSSENPQDYVTLTQEWGTVYRVLQPNEVLVTVPAGQFVSKDNQRYAIGPDGTRFDGQDNLYYANGIGEVRQTVSTVTTLRIIYEKQLVSYAVQ